MLEQILVAAVGFLGRGEARELAHGIKLAAISGRVDAAGKRRLAGVAEKILFAPIGWQIGGRVEAANRHAGNCGEARVPVLVEVHARWCADGSLWSFFERGGQGLLGPLLFTIRRIAAFEN